MSRALLLCAAVLLSCGWSYAQLDNRSEGPRGDGTINEMSNDPQQNQKLTGTMGSTNGSTSNAGAADHSNELGGKSPQIGDAGQPANVPPPGTGIQEKGKPMTSSPGAVAATTPSEGVKHQRNEKNLDKSPSQPDYTSSEKPPNQKK